MKQYVISEDLLERFKSLTQQIVIAKNLEIEYKDLEMGVEENMVAISFIEHKLVTDYWIQKEAKELLLFANYLKEIEEGIKCICNGKKGKCDCLTDDSIQ